MGKAQQLVWETSTDSYKPVRNPKQHIPQQFLFSPNSDEILAQLTK